jgi:hypothetical protein
MFIAHHGVWIMEYLGLAHSMAGRSGLSLGGGRFVDAATTKSPKAGRIGLIDALMTSVKSGASAP